MKRLRKLIPALVTLSLALAVPRLLSAQTYRSAEILANFIPVPGGISRVDDRTVAVLFHNSETALAALAIFPAHCDADTCTLDEPLGCAIFDAQGRMLQLYAAPGAEAFTYRVLAVEVASLETA